MASQPERRHVRQQIQAQGGWERIKERYASGEHITKLAKTFTKRDGTPISRQFFYRFIDEVPGLLQELQALRPHNAAAIFEKGLTVADEMPADRDAVLRDKAKADIYFRAAALIDRDQFGERPSGLQVTFNLPGAHVDALRHRMVEASRPLAELLAVPEGSIAGTEADASIGARDDGDSLSTPAAAP